MKTFVLNTKVNFEKRQRKDPNTFKTYAYTKDMKILKYHIKNKSITTIHFTLDDYCKIYLDDFYLLKSGNLISNSFSFKSCRINNIDEVNVNSKQEEPNIFKEIRILKLSHTTSYLVIKFQDISTIKWWNLYKMPEKERISFRDMQRTMYLRKIIDLKYYNPRLKINIKNDQL